MENADLIEQTIERLKSDGIDNLNKWITTCTEEEVFLQLVYEPKEVNSENNRRLSWLNILLFHYRLLDFAYSDTFFIIPAEPKPSTSVNTPRVRTDLGGGFEDDENIVTTTEVT